MSIFSEENLDQLINSCADGDKASLEYFFEKYSTEIYNFPIKVFHLSEDDAGEYFIYSFERLKDGKKFKQFNRKSSFKTWFYTVLRNLLIDWKKTKKEIPIVSPNKLNQDGVEYHTIESEPDHLEELKSQQLDETFLFKRVLENLKLENRVLFKLAYIYYLNLEEDEIKYLLQITGWSLEELRKKIFSIREELVQREKEILIDDEKLTYLHIQIRELEYQKKTGNTVVHNDNLPLKDRVQEAIDKKREQRRKLLNKKSRMNYPIRTPFRIISEILPMRELAISLALSRILEKLEIFLKKK